MPNAGQLCSLESLRDYADGQLVYFDVWGLG